MKCLTTGDCADDVKRLGSRCDRRGQRSVRGLMRYVFTACKEPQHGPPLSSNVVANGPTQHRILCFQCIKDRLPGHVAANLKFNISRDARKRSQVCRQNNHDHVSVCTSTESTGGRSLTIGTHVSPLSDDPYTCPPVVP